MKRNAVSLYDWCLANGQQTILEQWDSARNVGVSPRTIAYGSNKPSIGFAQRGIHMKHPHGHVVKAWLAQFAQARRS